MSLNTPHSYTHKGERQSLVGTQMTEAGRLTGLWNRLDGTVYNAPNPNTVE